MCACLETSQRCRARAPRQAHTTQPNANGRTYERNRRNRKSVASRKGGGEIRGGAVNPLWLALEFFFAAALSFACFALRYLSCLRYCFGRRFPYEYAFVPYSEIFCDKQSYIPFVRIVHFAYHVVAINVAFYEAV